MHLVMATCGMSTRSSFLVIIKLSNHYEISVVMMCSSCQWRITDALKKKGFNNFDRDMYSSTLTFKDDVNPERVIEMVNGISYSCEYIEEDVIDFDS